MLAIPDTRNRNQMKHIFRLYKPNSGLQSKVETLSSLREKGKKAEPEEVKNAWNDIFTLSESKCSHVLFHGNCKRAKCDVGIRRRSYCVLSGAVLTVWPELERAVPFLQTHRLQIVRLKTDDGNKFIGNTF